MSTIRVYAAYYWTILANFPTFYQRNTTNEKKNALNEKFFPRNANNFVSYELLKCTIATLGVSLSNNIRWKCIPEKWSDAVPFIFKAISAYSQFWFYTVQLHLQEKRQPSFFHFSVHPNFYFLLNCMVCLRITKSAL